MNKNHRTGIFALFSIMLMLFTTTLSAQFAGGDGTAANPWLISTPEQLAAVKETTYNHNLTNSYFKLISDIDLTAYVAPGGTGYNNGQGWSMIGDPSNQFKGNFDGNGKTIRGLKAAKTDGSAYHAYALFGYTTASALISNVKIENASMNGIKYCAALVGYNLGTVSFCTVSGNIVGTKHSGGLVGYNGGTIIQSSASGSVAADSTAGGLCGENVGTITCSYSQASATASMMFGGGLVAKNSGTIRYCYATGSVNGSGLGGLAGASSGSVFKSYWDKNSTGVTHSAGSDDSFGKTTAEMKQSATYAGWDFTVIWNISENTTYPYYQPVLPGSGSETDPYLISTVGHLGQIRNYTGSIKNNLYFKLQNNLDLAAYLNGHGSDDGAGWLPIGTEQVPFAAHFNGNGKRISGLKINRPDMNNVGLFGYSTGEISNLAVHITGSDAVTGCQYVGGLAGQNAGTISRCAVTGSDQSTINATFSFAGGFIGQNNGPVTNSYSTVNVRGNSNPGGFTGQNFFNGLITNCYASGKVSISNSGFQSAGGFCGTGGGDTDIINCYWNKETSGLNVSANMSSSFGKTTAEMKKLATFAGWDFTAPVWKISEGLTAPYLAYQEGNLIGLTAFPLSAGAVTGDGIFLPGDAVTIKALPVPEYTFEKWTGDLSSLPANSETNPALSFNMPAGNITLTAVFKKIFPFDSGIGTWDNPWMVADAQQLDQIRNYMASGKFFKLKNDIDLTEYLSPGNPGYNNGAFWQPIVAFKANFKGNGKKITGLKINRPGSNSVGFFTSIRENGWVEKTGFEVAAGDTIRGGYSTGIIAAEVSNGVILDCYTKGAVKGNEIVGGIVGSTMRLSMSDCYSTASVTGSKWVGGLAGDIWLSDITNSYAAGKVNGTELVGGMVGNYLSSTIAGSYWDKEATAQLHSAGSDDSFAKTTAEMKTQTTFGGWDFTGETANGTEDHWTINNQNNNGYPFLSWQLFPVPNAPSSVQVTGQTDKSFLVYWSESSTATGYRVDVATDSLFTSLVNNYNDLDVGNVLCFRVNNLSAGTAYFVRLRAYNNNGAGSNSAVKRAVTLYFAQAGTADDPYQIKTFAQLNNVRYLLGPENADKHFKIMNNIDASATRTNTWVPLGNETKTFNGNFDGGNFVISNLSCNVGGNYQAMFGISSGAMIKNVVMDSNCLILGNHGVGSIVGHNNGTIKNCHSAATIKIIGSAEHIGGITGISSGTITKCSFSGKIAPNGPDITINRVGGIVGAIGGTVLDSCSNSGSITGSSLIGGITGFTAEGMTISNSFNTGIIDAANYGGGISGAVKSNSPSVATIQNCYNLGEIKSGQDIGGLIGQAFYGCGSQIIIVKNCYSTGKITGTLSKGGLVGSSIPGLTVTNSFWDRETSQIYVSAGSDPSCGKTTAQMKTQATYTDWDFTGIWSMAANSNNGYPYLKWQPVASAVSESLIPLETGLAQNYPNPFNPTTAINYQLSAMSVVKLAVYNAKGELVKTLVNGNQNAGRYSVNFDGAGLNSGVYFYKLESDGKSMVKRMLMVK